MIQDLNDLRASNGLKNILSESVDIEYPKEFDDPQVFNDPKRILIGSMDFDKVLGDTSISGGLVFWLKHNWFQLRKVNREFRPP